LVAITAGIDIDPRLVQRAWNKEHESTQRNQRPARKHLPPPQFAQDRPPRRPPRHEDFREGRDDGAGPENRQPLALLDVNKTRVVGFLAQPKHLQLLPLYSAEKTLIGYIAYANRDRLMDDYELDLSVQLSSNLWWIASLMVLLSASLAIPFARLLLRPLRPIVGAIHTLAKGDFSQRISTDNNDEIGRVAKDINLLAQQLEEIDSSRKTWLANISHELRTPLAVMRGELEAMLDGIRELSKENVASAHQEALHL
jgi:two-component system sensor histidine kinase BaeS